MCIEFIKIIGPYLSGIGVIIASGAAWATLWFVQRRALVNEWTKQFSDLHKEFWEEENSSKVRAWITNDLKYAELQKILEQRNKENNNKLDDESNKNLEMLDRFCALLSRIAFYESSKMTKEQLDLWRLNFNFWLDKIKERQELAEYINQYWPGVLNGRANK